MGQDIKQIKREEAMLEVVKRYEEQVKAPMEYAYRLAGKSHDLTCSEDCVLASSQNYKRAAEKVLEEVREEGEYYKEQATMRLLAMLEAYEVLSMRFAELHQSYPEGIQKIMEFIPAFKALETHGEEVWQKVQDKI